jgi:hypothetical protein
MGKDGVVGKYLDLVKKIAKGKEDNTFSGTEDLEGKSEDEIMQVFVVARNSRKLASIKEEVNNKWRCMKNIFALSTQTIKPRFEMRLNQGPIELADSDVESEDNEDDI